MTYAPKTLTDLGRYWTGQGGVNLGIVGDTRHVSGYHLGRDRIYDGAGPGQGDEDYSVRHPRDKAGLTDAASAIDLGKLGGTYSGLQEFSRWLVKQCQAGAAGSTDVREIIYSPDGYKVQRWSGIDNGIHTGDGNGDSSHRSHTHISYFRDSQSRDKQGLFRPFFAEGTNDMGLDWYPIPRPAGVAVLKAGRGLVNLVTGSATVPDDTTKTVLGGVHLATPWSAETGMQNGYLVRHAQQAHVMLDGVTETFTPAPDSTAPVVSPNVLTGDDGSEYRRV